MDEACFLFASKHFTRLCVGAHLRLPCVFCCGVHYESYLGSEGCLCVLGLASGTWLIDFLRGLSICCIVLWLRMSSVYHVAWSFSFNSLDTSDLKLWVTHIQNTWIPISAPWTETIQTETVCLISQRRLSLLLNTALFTWYKHI